MLPVAIGLLLDWTSLPLATSPLTFAALQAATLFPALPHCSCVVSQYAEYAGTKPASMRQKDFAAPAVRLTLLVRQTSAARPHLPTLQRHPPDVLHSDAVSEP